VSSSATAAIVGFRECRSIIDTAQKKKLSSEVGADADQAVMPTATTILRMIQRLDVRGKGTPGTIVARAQARRGIGILIWGELGGGMGTQQTKRKKKLSILLWYALKGRYAAATGLYGRVLNAF